MKYIIDVPYWNREEGARPSGEIEAYCFEIVTDADLQKGDQIELENGRLLEIASRRIVLTTYAPGSRIAHPVANHIRLFCWNV